MPAPNLAPPESSSSAASFLIAAALLLAVAGVVAWRYVHHVTHASIPHVAVFPVHTDFRLPSDFSGSTVVGSHTSEDDLYLLVTLHLQNDNTIPVTLQRYQLLFLDQDGAQLPAQALPPEDIQTVLATFPKIKPLATPPLNLETTLAPGSSAEGMVLFQLPVSKADWDKRKSATLSAGFYHQPTITLPLPTH